MPKFMLIVLLIMILAVILVAGLQIQPRAFSLDLPKDGPTQTIGIPQDLPSQVQAFFKARFGDSIPLTRTVVFSGRGRIRPFGIWLPARFVFIHEAGKHYRHYFEATWFGLPFLRVEEGYVDGASFFESPMGSTHDDHATNQGANLALWAEAGWFPSIWAEDPRVNWNGITDQTAVLSVPFEQETEHFIVRFTPDTGLMDMMEAMRYRESGEESEKILWIVRNEPVPVKGKGHILARGSATWLDQGKPWAYFDLEKAWYNIPVEGMLRARGLPGTQPGK